MTPPLKSISALALLLALAIPAIDAQQPRTVVLIDPAHGGPDSGAHLTDDLLEKNLTLAFATRLRAVLASAGFTLISTRDADPTVPFTTDQRAEIANHSHPAVCLILHATNAGSGIHVVTSAFPPPDETYDPDAPHFIIPWNTAQTASIPQSIRLANELGVALLHAKLPVLLLQASVPPLDNVTCPAAAIEIAPLHTDSKSTPLTDSAYQQSIAQAIAAGIASWRTHNPPPGAAR